MSICTPVPSAGPAYSRPRKPTGERAVPTPLRLLMLEDKAADAELIVHELRRTGLELLWKRVETEEEFRASLDPRPDLILADYTLPSYDGLRALRLVRGCQLDIPFIVVSATIGEELAATSMREGADDYVMKDRLTRLGPAAENALEEKRLRDDTQRAEERLLESLERYRSLFERVPVGLYRTMPSGQIVDGNPALAAMLGLPDREALLEVNAASLYASSEERAQEQLLLERDGIVRGFETTLRRRDGTLIHVRDNARVTRDETGTVLYNEGSLEDITQRRRVEEEIRRRNRELALLNRIISVSVADRSVEAILEAVCRELAAAFEVPYSAAVTFCQNGTQTAVATEWGDGNRRQSFASDLCSATLATAERLAEYGKPLGIDSVREDPRLAPICQLVRERDTASLLILPLTINNVVIGSLWLESWKPRPFSVEEMNIAQRVAEQVSGALSRARLQQTQMRLSFAIEQAAEAVIITDDAGHILYANPNFEKLTGLSRSEIIGQPTQFIGSGLGAASTGREIWDTVSAGQVWHGRVATQRQSGEAYTIDATVAPVRDEAGSIVNYIGTMRDVSREVQLEEHFRRAQKMEALGQLAGGVAHDFNNLLTVIQLSTRLLEQQLCSQDGAWKHVQRIREAGERGSNLTRQLLSFSRREMARPQVVSLNDAIRDLSKMLQRLVREDISLEMALAEQLWKVKIDLTQVDQVIMNLAVNASDAMPQGGTLILRTANVVLDEAFTAENPDVQPGEYVFLGVSDSGVGMDEEVRSHLFEPFFTTKEPGKGTGLGLATVFGVVTQNHGHIRVRSQVGEGTDFELYLPRSTESVEPEQAPSANVSRGARSSRTILLVEDDKDVRELSAQILTAHGYHVLTAGDGLAGLRVSQEFKGPIHLLLTDVVMPHMSGPELAARLKDQRPEMPVLFASGYTRDVIAYHEVTASGDTFIRKPFSEDRLTQKVQTLLGDHV